MTRGGQSVNLSQFFWEVNVTPFSFLLFFGGGGHIRQYFWGINFHFLLWHIYHGTKTQESVTYNKICRGLILCSCFYFDYILNINELCWWVSAMKWCTGDFHGNRNALSSKRWMYVLPNLSENGSLSKNTIPEIGPIQDQGLPFQNDSNFNKTYAVHCTVHDISNSIKLAHLGIFSLMTFLIAPCPRCPFMLETIVARNYMCDLIKPKFPLNLIVLSDFLFLLLETLNSEEN